MRNIAICIGCDDYDRLGPLHGAVADSRHTFELLTSSGLYDGNASSLLSSPTAHEVRARLDLLASQRNIGVLTFYFAGHGGVKAGTYYLCCRDADPAKLSTTALPIVHFFTVIGEIQPRQVNFVIDACQAAGSMFDIGTLAKPDLIGPAGSFSIAFLAASASNQYANETPSGGIATTALVRYLNGEKQVQQNRRYLDLVEVGLAVSRDVASAAKDQVPTAWGLNLYGEGVFAMNPHYRGDTDAGFSVEGIAPTSAAGLVIGKMGERLWEEYRRIVSEPDAARLRRTVAAVRIDLGTDFPNFVKGFAGTLAARAGAAHDLLAGSDALAVCAVSLLPQLGTESGLRACREILVTRTQVDAEALAYLRQRLDSSKYALLAESHSLADLHYLPIRLSKVLAWLALARATVHTLGLNDAGMTENIKAIAHAIFAHYPGSFVSVSDEQAPWTYIFVKYASMFGCQHQTRTLLGRLFATAATAKGRVLRVNASGKNAFNYSLARAGINSPVALEDLANPSALLSTLLLLGHQKGLSTEWDTHLIRMDGITLNAYVPDDYAQFDESLIRGGNNYTNRLGHGVWCLDDYAAAFAQNVMPHVKAATIDSRPEARLLCALSAYLYPDRVPLLLEMQESVWS